MSTRMLTGLLLIIGPIVLLAGFIGISASGSAPTDWSDTAGSVAELDNKWFQEIVDGEIHPLIQEYWFDDAEKVRGPMTDMTGAVKVY